MLLPKALDLCFVFVLGQAFQKHICLNIWLQFLKYAKYPQTVNLKKAEILCLHENWLDLLQWCLQLNNFYACHLSIRTLLPFSASEVAAASLIFWIFQFFSSFSSLGLVSIYFWILILAFHILHFQLNSNPRVVLTLKKMASFLSKSDLVNSNLFIWISFKCFLT